MPISNTFNFDDHIDDPLAQELFRRSQAAITARTAGRPNIDVNQVARDIGSTVGLNVGAFGGAALPLGLGTMLEVLAGKGRTDPRLRDHVLNTIDSRTQARTNAIGERAAQRGNASLGLVQALQAASDQAGDTQASQFLAQEAREAEARKRADLGLLLQMIINPANQQFGIERGVAIQNRALDVQQQGNKLNFLGQLVGGLGGLFK